MKNYFYYISVILACLIFIPLQAQTIKQQGVTYRYNGKNKRTPIGGVYIKAVSANNGEVSDEKTGAFELALNNLKMGERIGNVRVTKQGMMVFNQQAVDEWSVRKEPLCLILCNADEFQKQKKKLIAIGEGQARKKYDKKLAELKKRNAAKQIKIDEYYNKLDSLEKEYQNALKHMDEYADVFARIDESEVDTVAQRAIEMFNRGEIEESLHLLEQQNYLDKIKHANSTIEQADKMIFTAEQAKSLAEQDKQKYLDGIKIQIAGYKLQNEWDKAKRLLKGLADILNTLEAVAEYADFCANQNDFKEAEEYFLRLRELIETKNYICEAEKQIWLVYVMNYLAHLYGITQRSLESEETYKLALRICEHLVKPTPSPYEYCLANTQNNMATFYRDIRRYSESEEMYNLSLKIYERLSKDNPSVYEPGLATVQNDLASLYYIMHRYVESERLYKSALEIRNRLSKNNSIYLFSLASTINDLANLYRDNRRYSESESMYKFALEVRERLAKANPHAYEPALAQTQNGMGNLYRNSKRYSESEEMYKLSLKIDERFVKISPLTYESNLAMTQHNLALLYYDSKRFLESEMLYKSALEIRERLSKINPSRYEPDLALTQSCLALLYCDTKRYDESEKMYRLAMEIYEHLVKESPSVYEPELASMRNNLAGLYNDIKQYERSENMYKSSQKIYERLAKITPSVYEPALAITHCNLALLYNNTHRYAESEVLYREALKMFIHLHLNAPQIYKTNLMDCYYRLGGTLLMLGKVNDAKESFEQSLDLARQMDKAVGENSSYLGSLYYLSQVSSTEKNHNAAYSYGEELIPFQKALYEKDPEKWNIYYWQILVNQSLNANILGKFVEGEKYSREAIKLDSTKHIAYTNLAAALLFQGKVKKAEILYMQYKSELRDGFLEDFAEYERVGIIPKERKADVERIKAMLNE